MHIYCLQAHRRLDTGEPHYFMELFSSMAKLQAYLYNHPEVSKDEITGFEVDPQ